MTNHFMMEFLKSYMKSNINNKYNQDCQCLNYKVKMKMKVYNKYNTKMNAILHHMISICKHILIIIKGILFFLNHCSML
jgi:hypothetical protein